MWSNYTKGTSLSNTNTKYKIKCSQIIYNIKIQVVQVRYK